MARKWSNKNLPGALQFLTSNLDNRRPMFKNAEPCQAVVDIISELRAEWPFKLIAYVIMPDHIHLVVNPRDGKIRELAGKLKSLCSRKLISLFPEGSFVIGQDEFGTPTHQVWQESFKAMPLWSPWMIWQKINYIHSNPLKAKLVKTTADYRWSSFRSFYLGEHDPIQVDRDWWWPDDVRKLAVAMKEWSEEKN